MFEENKNLKDSRKDFIKDTSSLSATYQAEARLPDGQNFSSVSYKKINKLITGLYMVTDIIDKDEPIRNKLRTLGLEIISDTSAILGTPIDMVMRKINQITSFLDIASTVNIISEMNCSIIKNEFLKLNQSVKESVDKIKTLNKEISLSEFFKDSSLEDNPSLTLPEGEGKIPPPLKGYSSKWGINSKGHYSIGHEYPTRIGVQKGSTLMKALSDKIIEARPNVLGLASRDFNILKKQRRDDIMNVIKNINGNATIKDIKDKVRAVHKGNGPLASFSEKTLQRELVSMVKDNVLGRTGEKRWSRYFLRG